MTSAQEKTAIARYQTKLNRVVEHIHAHLDTDLKSEELAEVAHLSSYHWHRIYRSMRGESMNETIRRIRLQRAGDQLANSDIAVADIASSSGYGSVEAFTRAFKDFSGQTPAAFRESGSHARFRQANEAIDASGFKIVVKELPATTAYAQAARGPYMQIDRAFEGVIGRLMSAGAMDSSSRLLGVFHDDPDMIEPEDLTAHACVITSDPVNPNSTDDETYAIRGGQYACLHYTGPYSDMKEAYRWFFGVWLPSSGFDADDAPMLEEYLNSPMDVPASELQTMICLPIKAAVEELGEQA